MGKFICILVLSFLFIQCKSDDDSSRNPISQLPPATQTGENRAGCLINGEVYVPRGGGLRANLTCAYEFVDGEYYFSLVLNYSKGEQSKILQVFLRKIIINQGGTYSLNIDRVNNPLYLEIMGGGGYYFETVGVTGPSNEYTTNEIQKGELKITTYDPQNSIMSGTFWFDTLDADGEVIEIREGRFDTEYF